MLSFAKDGYAAASLREIAAGANISLGMIHMYFGSKAELYMAVNRRIWIEISNERDALLRQVLDARAGGAPPLHELIRALALPIVRRALSTAERDSAQLLVIRSRISEQRRLALDAEVGHSLVHWVDALSLACPTLSRQRLVWVYSFLIGTIWSWQSVDHRYDGILCQDLQREVEDVLEDIVTFGCAGVQAIIDRAKPPHGGAGTF